MIVLKESIAIDKTSEIPVYLQVANALIHHIRHGRLRRGLKLPGSREMAGLLKIHRKTMLAALDELMAQGWIEMIPRKGTFVVNDLPEIKPKKLQEQGPAPYPEKTLFQIDEKRVPPFPPRSATAANALVINDGFPDTRLAPTELFIREMRSLSKQRNSKTLFGYGSPKGPDVLRETLASFLGDTRGLPIGAQHVMITRGAQMGIYLAGSLILQPGDHVIVGDPGYFGATLTFRQLGANINFVPVDDFGIDVDAIAKLAAKKKIKLLYVIPHHHHPTTVTLTPERRVRLLELAARYRFAIIEDDYDYDFHYTSNPVLPMASLDHHGNIIYIGTLSKTLAPTFRLGFVVAPENFINAIANIRKTIDWQGDSLMEAAIAELYRNGTIGRHIKKVVKLYRERRDHFCTLLQQELGDHVSFKIPDGGMSVWTKFNGANLKRIATKAAEKGLIMPDPSFYNTNTNFNAIRMGFASLNIKEQDRAMEILTNSLEALGIRN